MARKRTIVESFLEVLARYIGILLDQLLQSVKFTIVVFHLNKLSGYLGFSCGSRREKQITWIRCFSHVISIQFSSRSLLNLDNFFTTLCNFGICQNGSTLPTATKITNRNKGRSITDRPEYSVKCYCKSACNAHRTQQHLYPTYHMKETMGTFSNIFNNYSTSARWIWDDR